MGQIEGSQHGEFGGGRRIHPFREMAHLAIYKAREAPDIAPRPLRHESRIVGRRFPRQWS